MLKKNFKIYAFTLIICGLVTMENSGKIKEAFQKNEDQSSYTVGNTSSNTLLASKTVNKTIPNDSKDRQTQKKFYLLNLLVACTPKNRNIYLDDFFFRYGTGSIFLHGFAPYLEWGINEVVSEYYDVIFSGVNLYPN